MLNKTHHQQAARLSFSSLLDDGTASAVGEYTMTMQRHWTCPRCDVSMVVSIRERLEHEAVCQASNITATHSEDKADQEEERNMQMNPLRKSFFCDKCDKQLQLTMTEILKHKKSYLDNS